MNRRVRVLCVGVGLLTFAVSAGGKPKVVAPTKRKPVEHVAEKREPKKNVAKSEAADTPDADKVEEPSPTPESPAAPGKAPPKAPEAKELRFGELEIEGRLKSPQLMYFLRRVRAEFYADALGHRSFSLELEDTRNSGAVE